MNTSDAKNSIDWSAALLTHFVEQPEYVGEPSLQSCSAQQMLLETILNQLPDGILLCDIQGNVLFLNHAARCLISPGQAQHSTAAAFAGLEWTGRSSSTDIPWPLVQALRGEPTVAWEASVLRPDGNYADMLISGCPLWNAQQTVIGAVLTCRDVTQQKQAQQAQEDMRRAQTVAQTGNWRLDVRHNRLLWSDETYRMFGIATETPLTYELFLNSVHPDDRAFVDRSWTAALRGEPYDIEHRIVVNSQVKWVHERAEMEFDEQGNLRGGFGTVQDITERKRVEDQLQSVARFPSENPNPILRISGEGVVLYGNEASGVVQDTWGCQPGDTLAQPWRDIVARALLSGQILELEMDCNERRFLLQFIPISDHGYVNIYGRDITKQKQAEEVLRQSEERLRAVFDNAALGILEADDKSRIVGVNNRGCQILGYDRDDLLHMDLDDLTAPEDRAISREISEQLYRGDQDLFDYEKHYIKRDGSRLWAHVTVSAVRDSSGRFLRGIGTIEDISVRKQAEDQLRYQALLLENIHDAVFSTNLEFEIVSWNQAAEQIYGWTAKEVQGRTLAEVLNTGALDQSVDEFRRHFFEHSQWQGELIRTRKDGTRIVVQSSAKMLLDRRGQPIGVVAIERDITDQKRMEEQALELMSERERMQALTEFVQHVSHDFKTPLSTLKTGLYLLTKVSEQDRQHHQISIMQQQTQRLTDLLEGMLSMTRLDRKATLDLELIDLNHLVKKIYGEKQASAERKGLTLQLHLAEQSLVLQADAAELAQAFTNVLNNAIQFTPRGTVSLQAGRQSTRAVVEIHDTGIGIDEADLPHIFERLYRADKARGRHTGGVGLGLAIAQKIVHLHGGEIAVSSALGEGTTVRVWLPLAEA